MNVEDVMLEQERLDLERALQHAAQASLTCTGRTLGPDREPLWVDKPLPGPQTKDDPATVSAEKAEETKEPVPAAVEALPEPSLSCFPDADVVNASILKRELAQETKRSVRLQIDALKEKMEACRLQRQSLQDKEEERHREKMEQKVLQAKNDNNIRNRAVLLTEAQMEAQQQEQQAHHMQTKQKLHKLALEGVARCQRRFNQKYEGMAKLLLSLDPETVQVCASHNRQLKDLTQQFEQLVGAVTAGKLEHRQFLHSIVKAEQYCCNLDLLELDMIKQLTEFSEQIEQHLKAEADRKLQQKEEEERQKRQAEEKRRLEEKADAEARQKQQKQVEADEAAKTEAAKAAPPGAQPQGAQTAQPQTASNLSATFVHPERLKFYNEILALYQTKVDAVKPLQTEEALKQYRTGCQRAINLPLNAISAVSPQHLSNNFEKLLNFFAGQPVKMVNGAAVSINDHPLARDYCLLLMAKKFVSQTETAISSNPQAAFPFASVIVTFWKLLPDFGKVFLAYLYKESPFLVPYVIPQQPEQSPEQYLKTIGYRLCGNELEKPDMFLKRQTGIARLYAAVIITPGRKADGPQHCFGLEEGWRWLAHVVQVKPLPDVSATLIMEILQTLGFELWRSYGKQFLKLLLYIQNSYMPQLAVFDEGGPKTRLEMLLAKFLRERQIPQAVGVLPAGFW